MSLTHRLNSNSQSAGAAAGDSHNGDSKLMFGGVGTQKAGGSNGVNASNNEVAFALLKNFVVPLFLGLFMGAAFHLSHADEFSIIRGQMTFQIWVMMKMFFAALATSSAILAAIRHIHTIAQDKSSQQFSHSNVYSDGANDLPERTTTKKTESVLSLSFQSLSPIGSCANLRGLMSTQFARGPVALLLGASFIGAAMGLVGSCPGTVYAQIGAGSQKAWAVFAGGLFGATAFGLLDCLPSFRQFLLLGNESEFGKKYFHSTLDLLFFGSGHSSAALSSHSVGYRISAALFFLVFLLELLFPWQSDLRSVLPAQQTQWGPSIPPSIAGIVLGSLQLPLLSLLGAHLGTSSSYATLMANALPFIHSSPHFNTFRRNYWQVAFMAGVTLGAFLCSQVFFAKIDNGFRSDAVISWPLAGVSGFLLVFGARMANGCTSGHGISGVAHLGMPSIFALLVMFASAISIGIIRSVTFS